MSHGLDHTSVCVIKFLIFFCFSAFNNVYSNIGYIMLGILFILLVVRRCVSRYLLCKTIRNILKIKLVLLQKAIVFYWVINDLNHNNQSFPH